MSNELEEITDQLHEWTDAALALDDGHFPQELLHELEDLISEFRAAFEDNPDVDRGTYEEMLLTPEMAEVVGRFDRLSRMLEKVLGSDFIERLEEEREGFVPPFDEDDE